MVEKARLWCSGVVLALLAAGGPVWPADADTTAQEAIGRQVARINEAWTSDTGGEIMRSVLSDTFTASLPNPAKAGTWLTLDKERFCSGFDKMLRETRPKQHVHTTTKVTVKGGVAYELGVSVHVNAAGVRTSDEVLNVWKLEGQTWMLLFSAKTADIKEAVQQP